MATLSGFQAETRYRQFSRVGPIRSLIWPSTSSRIISLDRNRRFSVISTRCRFRLSWATCWRQSLLGGSKLTWLTASPSSAVRRCRSTSSSCSIIGWLLLDDDSRLRIHVGDVRPLGRGHGLPFGRGHSSQRRLEANWAYRGKVALRDSEDLAHPATFGATNLAESLDILLCPGARYGRIDLAGGADDLRSRV